MGDAEFSLINLKGISKPATKLVEAVRSAFGAVHEPTGIRRKADAEAEAAVTSALGEADAANIKAKSQVEVAKILAEGGGETAEIEQRTAIRLIGNEVRRQKNREAITRQAVTALPESVSEDPVDEDWIHQFYGYCEDVSNEQMQSIWGRLLAGEVEKPGSFSPRTLGIVKEMRTDEAHLFTALCRLTWGRVKSEPTPFIMNSNDLNKLGSVGLDFTALLHLETLGLIQMNTLSGYKQPNIQRTLFSYFNTIYDVQHESHGDLPLGHVLLTNFGKELYPISGGTPSEEHRTFVIEHIKKQGFSITEFTISTSE